MSVNKKLDISEKAKNIPMTITLLNMAQILPESFPKRFAKFDPSATFPQIFVFVFFVLRGRI